MAKPKRTGSRSRAPRTYRTRRAPARPRASARSRGLQPTDANPIWALYRNIGQRISDAMKGRR